jgi:CTP:molybdopterin cytidylyltransferase MocA
MNQELTVIGVITAGWSPKEDDPLTEYTQGKSKALISIAGKPMIAHVIDALAGSRYVQRSVIVGLDPNAKIAFSMPVDLVPDTGSLIGNVETGLLHAMEHYPAMNGALLSGSDVPTITPAIVDAFIDTCLRTDHDVYYSIIEQSVMEARFPNSRRSYVRLKDGNFAGGDLMYFRKSTNLGDRELWDRLANSRKHPLRQVAVLGLWPLLKLVTGRLSLAEAEERACKIIKMRGHAIPFPYAEVGMDVDKPHQLEIVRAELEAQAAGN